MDTLGTHFVETPFCREVVLFWILYRVFITVLSSVGRFLMLLYVYS